MLKQKTALITGASRGIGRAIALEFAKNGANVALLYAGNEALANEVKAACAAHSVMAEAYLCDVSDFDACKEVCGRIVKHFGGVDILVNNAGITIDKLALQMSESDFDRVVDINLKGSFNMIRHLYSNFMRKRAGRIINISSVAGIAGNAGQANYSSAKAGLIGLTKSIARELASRNVTCNAIAPGFIETDMTRNLPQKAQQAARDSIPMGRMGSVLDIAKLALFLASDNAGYITGEVIRADGGMCI
jgi:3-oxoacyl-[acyl-carrier protein] reductase